MTLLPVSDYLGDSAALCDAVVRLRGPALVAELGRIASAVMASPHGQFLPAGSMDAAASSAIFSSDTPALLQEISFDGHCFGHYSVAGRSLGDLLAGTGELRAIALRSRVGAPTPISDDTLLQGGETLVLSGKAEALARAEKLLAD